MIETERPDKRSLSMWKALAIVSGPLVAALIFVCVPNDYLDANQAVVNLGVPGRATLAMMAWMCVWWITEATDISTTALLPLAMFPLLGVASIDQAASPYGDPVIFLFMGGFVLALSMQRWGLGERIAYCTLLVVGTRPSNVILGFMVITATISGFVSNVATVAMMMPIAMSVIDLMDRQNKSPDPKHREQSAQFSSCLLLAVAYASSVGGMATKIGTPPNVLLASFLEKLPADQQVSISFLDWMAFGVPLAVIMLFFIWLLMTRILFQIPDQDLAGSRELIVKQLQNLGPVKRGELVTAVVFGITVMAWMTSPLLKSIQISRGDWTIQPLAQISDTSIVMIAALVLFLVPVPKKDSGVSPDYVMNWETARSIPWNILLLFGGGLSLAKAVTTNGVAEFLAANLSFLSGTSPWLVVLVVTTVVVFLTELTSNTSTTASLLPVLIGFALVVNMPVAILAISVTLSASCAFMLPVATPPNAIVFSTGRISMQQMMVCGFWINLISIVLITLLVLYWVPWVLA